jgi:hypothetical protein
MSDEIERPLHFIREKAKEYAQAKANRIYLSEFRKSKKAILMVIAEQRTQKTTVSERENFAYSHPEYLELLEGLKVAIEIEEHLALDIEAARLSVEIWRTRQANERAERHSYGVNNG